jgi:DNA-binding GntR family transcriptional regulator
MDGGKPDIQTHILRMIVKGDLQPGDTVDEAGLAEQFGLSRTPVREAVLRLEARDILEKRPRAGAAVARLDTAGLIELIELHSELEGAAAYHAARRGTGAQVAALVDAAKAYDAAIAAGEPAYDLNLAFHLAVFAGANNPTLSAMLDITGVRLIAYFRAQESLRTGQGRAVAEHAAIVAAIEAGDADGARTAMRRHAEIASDTLLDVLAHMSG